jgi:hypothetical protein
MNEIWLENQELKAKLKDYVADEVPSEEQAEDQNVFFSP